MRVGKGKWSVWQKQLHSSSSERRERERVHTTSSLAAQLRGPEGAWTTDVVDDNSIAVAGEGAEEVVCCNGEERGDERREGGTGQIKVKCVHDGNHPIVQEVRCVRVGVGLL